MEPRVKMVNIKKKFGEVEALHYVNLTIYPDEILGFVGDNGAGKSTLVKILSGVYPPTEGEIFIEGKKVEFPSPLAARQNGISIVHQILALCDNLSVVDNLFLGVEVGKAYFGKVKFSGLLKLLDEKSMKKQSYGILDRIGIKLQTMKATVANLSGGQRQAVAIGKALTATPKVLILDEPTAGLAAGRAVKKTRELIKNLKEQGVSIILISHDLEDIFAVCDRVTVLRHGRMVGEKNINKTTRDEILSMMITVADK